VEGSIDSGGNSATQDESGRTIIPIDCGSVMSFQNQQDYGYLSLVVVQEGKIVGASLTTAAYGVITMNDGCQQEEPVIPLSADYLAKIYGVAK
jgi:hypothetical protein